MGHQKLPVKGFFIPGRNWGNEIAFTKSMKYIFTLFAVLLVKVLPAQVLSLAIKREVVDSLSKALAKNYIFPDTAQRMGAYIENRLKAGSYDKMMSGNAFAQALTTDIRSVYNDAHLSISYDPQMQHNLADTTTGNAAEKRRQNLAEYAQQNFGFKKLEILNGNIGYVSFDRFYGFNDYAKEVVNTAFSFLKNTNALIIDLRNNGGGSPDMEKYICSFLVPPGTQLSSVYERRTHHIETAFTYQPSIAVSFVGKPIYILVNRRSFSAAEALCYDLQNIHRATIIGETTGGGAHLVGPNSISNGFIGLIPFARAISPVTGTDWEAVGVQPDVRINADSSLDAAVLLYYNYQLSKTKDSAETKGIIWSRDMLEAKLHPYHADSSIAKTYIGIYASRLISFENGQLYYTGANGKKSKLVALSSNLYKIDDIDYMKIEFLKNGNGEVTEMNFIFNDGFVANYKKKN